MKFVVVFIQTPACIRKWKICHSSLAPKVEQISFINLGVISRFSDSRYETCIWSITIFSPIFLREIKSEKCYDCKGRINTLYEYYKFFVSLIIYINDNDISYNSIYTSSF